MTLQRSIPAKRDGRRKHNRPCSRAGRSGHYDTSMPVRTIRADELPSAAAMMQALSPTPAPYDFTDETIFVWEREDGTGLGGFISVSMRSWAEGCESEPVPYVEGWWVAPDLRGHGVGRALMSAVEQWCRDRGYSELGSDAEIENVGSLHAHTALGFERTLRLQFFRKRLG